MDGVFGVQDTTDGYSARHCYGSWMRKAAGIVVCLFY